MEEHGVARAWLEPSIFLVLSCLHYATTLLRFAGKMLTLSHLYSYIVLDP